MKDIKTYREVTKYLCDCVWDLDGRVIRLHKPGRVGLPEIMHFWVDGRVDFLEVKKPHLKRQRHLGRLEVRKAAKTGHNCYWLDSKEDVDRYLQGTLPRVEPKPESEYENWTIVYKK